MQTLGEPCSDATRNPCSRDLRGVRRVGLSAASLAGLPARFAGLKVTPGLPGLREREWIEGDSTNSSSASIKSNSYGSEEGLVCTSGSGWRASITGLGLPRDSLLLNVFAVLSIAQLSCLIMIAVAARMIANAHPPSSGGLT